MTLPGDERYPCPRCGGTRFVEGFVDDMVSGKVRWAAGRFRSGFLGFARGRGQFKGLPVVAYRCVACSRLELFATDPDEP